jgi:hypothetical protein
MDLKYFIDFGPLAIFLCLLYHIDLISVADPDSDPQDLYVFGPPGSESGSISTRYVSGSRSFYNQAKIVRKTLNSYCL